MIRSLHRCGHSQVLILLGLLPEQVLTVVPVVNIPIPATSTGTRTCTITLNDETGARFTLLVVIGTRGTGEVA